MSQHSPNQYLTVWASTTPEVTFPKTMMGAMDSPLEKPLAKEDRPKSGFVALEVRMRAARAAAEVLMLMYSSCQYWIVSFQAAWLKGIGLPK